MIDVASLPNNVDALKEIIMAERDRNSRLEHLIAAFKQVLFGRKSEKLDADQFELSLEDIEVAIACVGAEKDTSNENQKQTDKKPRAANRGALPKHLPRIENVIKPESMACACGGDLHVIGEDVSERLDVIPAQFQVIVTRRPKYACRSCEEAGVNQAPAPAHLIHGGLPTEALVAHVLVSKYADHCVPRRHLGVLKVSNYVKDEGGPFGARDRNLASNHRKLRALRALVVSVAEKTGRDPVRCDLERRTQVNRRRGVESVWMRSEPEPGGRSGISLSGAPKPGSIGLRHEGGASPDQAFTWNLGTCRCDAKGDVQMGSPHKDQSTDAQHRGGAVRSRVESAVMALDRRGCGVQLWPVVNHQTMGRTA